MGIVITQVGLNSIFLGQDFYSLPAEVVLINTVQNMSATGILDAPESFDLVESWSYTITPPPTISDPSMFFSISAGDSFEITYTAEPGTIPLEYIRYLDKVGNLEEISGWGDLPIPENSPEMIKMQENTVDHIRFTIEVTVTGIEDEVPAEETGTFNLNIVANYESSGELIRDAVADRISVFHDSN